MKTHNKNYIGFFDSGIGGISIWKRVKDLLPNENTIYLADCKNAPYGQKSKEEIIELSIKNTEFLLNQNVKIIVVACNTATTNAIQILRSKYTIPFIGIEPAIKPAGLITKTQRIGILATDKTLNSDLFAKTSEKLDSDIKIIEQVGKGLVNLIEGGHIESNEIKNLLHQYLQPMLQKNIDTLVLGCTHYSYLIPEIKKIIGKHIKIIDSSLAVAKQTKNILHSRNLLNINNEFKTIDQFYSNKNTTILSRILKNLPVTICEKNF
ncbi:MAG: Glutamate racemase [Flavobacterium sp. SCGC AAA160-P02]|nr:MAG: Glutamate racemase [Flavobacterium sp. SCGC AAA160-P02]